MTGYDNYDGIKSIDVEESDCSDDDDLSPGMEARASKGIDMALERMSLEEDNFIEGQEEEGAVIEGEANDMMARIDKL